MTPIRSQFLAPPVAAEERPVPRASDCGETAMRRLRHPFAVVADATPRPAQAVTTAC